MERTWGEMANSVRDRSTSGWRIGGGTLAALGMLLLVFLLADALILSGAVNIESAEAFVEKNQQRLKQLAEQAHGKRLDFEELDWRDQWRFCENGLEYIDGRDFGLTTFGFGFTGEGERVLYYSPNGAEAVLSQIEWKGNGAPLDAGQRAFRVEGLGINGKGYVAYRALSDEFFFVEDYLPT